MMYSNLGLNFRETLPLKGLSSKKLTGVKNIGTQIIGFGQVLFNLGIAACFLHKTIRTYYCTKTRGALQESCSVYLVSSVC